MQRVKIKYIFSIFWSRFVIYNEGEPNRYNCLNVLLTVSQFVYLSSCCHRTKCKVYRQRDIRPRGATIVLDCPPDSFTWLCIHHAITGLEAKCTDKKTQCNGEGDARPRSVTVGVVIISWSSVCSWQLPNSRLNQMKNHFLKNLERLYIR